jgi:hypothetical protein
MHIKVTTDNGGLTYEAEDDKTAKEMVAKLVDSMDDTGFMLIGNEAHYEAIAARTVLRIEVTA